MSDSKLGRHTNSLVDSVSNLNLLIALKRFSLNGIIEQTNICLPINNCTYVVYLRGRRVTNPASD